MNERIRVWLLAAISLLVYANTLANQFVYDDGYYVLGNPGVTTLSLTKLFQPTQGNNIFRPVTFATFALNWATSGARPFGYHLLNILLHAAVTLLLYLLLGKLLEANQHVANIAFVGALLFAVHPIHTEAVAWVSGRSELLAAAFLFVAWLLHLKDRPVAAMLCFVLGLLSKESAVVFLLLVLAGDFALGKLKPLSRYGWIAGLTMFYVALLWKLQGGQFQKSSVYAVGDNPLANLPTVWRTLNALRVGWKYVGLQVYPGALSCDYSYNAILLYGNLRHTLPAALASAALLILWLWAAWTKRNAWTLAGGIYFAGFAVTSNVFVSIGTIMGERLAYLASAGFCLVVALLWVSLYSFEKKAAYGALGIIVAVLGVRTVIRNRDWKDNFTLFSASVRVVPESARAHALLGQEYLRRGELDAARAELQTATAILPDSPESTENYGLAEARAGHDREARQLLEKALVLTRKSDSDYNFRAENLAAWFVQHGDDNDGLHLLNQIIADSPEESRAWSNLAVIRYRRGDLTSARAAAVNAIRLDPANTQAQNVLSTLDRAAATPARQTR